MRKLSKVLNMARSTSIYYLRKEILGLVDVCNEPIGCGQVSRSACDYMAEPLTSVPGCREGGSCNGHKCLYRVLVFFLNALTWHFLY